MDGRGAELTPVGGQDENIFSETGTSVSGNGAEKTGTPFEKAVPILAGVTAVLLLLLLLLIVFRKRGKGKNGRKEKEADHGKESVAPQENGAVKGRTVTLEETQTPEGIRVGRLHAVGRRKGQQDSFAVSDEKDDALCREKGVIAIVADGMGGLADGDRISSMVTLSFFRHFHERPVAENAGDSLLQMLKEANEEVNRFLGDNLGKCGSTLVAGIVKDKKCYWISVGDSHIYLYRGGSLMQLNREHVYGADLDAKAANGEISREEALRDPQRGALTSYIGMGRLEKVDRNLKSLVLQAGDRLLFMTDGVFGTLSESCIAEAMKYPVEQSMLFMDEEIRKVGKANQDNYTAVVLECCS